MPTTIPKILSAKSSKIMANAMITPPSAGRVSRPENGTAKNAPAVQSSTMNPKIERMMLFSSSPLSRGREYFSNHLMRLTMNGRARLRIRPSSEIFRKRCGIQSERRPTNICAAAIKETGSSKMWVMPPVVTGSAGTLSIKRKTMAKLFCSNISIMVPRVLVCLPASHSETSWLNGMFKSVLIGCPIAGSIE